MSREVIDGETKKEEWRVAKGISSVYWRNSYKRKKKKKKKLGKKGDWWERKGKVGGDAEKRGQPDS